MAENNEENSTSIVYSKPLKEEGGVENQSTTVVTVENKTNQQKKSKDKRTTSMVLAIVFFCVAIVFTLTTVLIYLDAYTSVGSDQEGLNSAVALLTFILFYGFFTYLPALIFSIVGVVMSGVGLKSTSKGHKVVCGIFLFLNIALLVALVLAVALVFLLQAA